MKLAKSFLVYLCTGVAALAAGEAENKKPNFIVILTDDQDLRMDSMDYMPRVKEHLGDRGTSFNHHYVTVSLCCPSRASMWTGKAAHNTNITDLKPPYGGFPKFLHEGYNKKWLPVWLQKAGYKTYFTGKLMNSHTSENYQRKLDDMGLDGHDFMIEPGTYRFLNATFQHNLEKPKSYPGKYATDLLGEKSLAWIDKAAKDKSPFFLAINPVNPHSNRGDKGWTPPIPAKRHEHMFQDAKVPRNVSFNPEKASGAGWVKELDQLSDETIKENDHYYRRRLQSLQSVDDLVHDTVERLKKYNMLDNTYIIYTSDNGFHMGQHRLTPGKRCPYEEDVNVPMVIRGPGVPEGKKADFVTSHLDIAPTIVAWARGTGPDDDFDGSVIPKDANIDPNEPWEHVQIEHWGMASDKDIPLGKRSNTYKAIRVIGPKYNLYYSVWCGGDHEVYDMTTDPYQMENLYNTGGNVLDVSMEKLQHRLDAVLLVLKTCKGKTCRRPWEAMHPAGDVKSLAEALDPKFDQFYEDQNKVGFEHRHKCGRGYIVDNEMPIDYQTFGEHDSGESSNAEGMKTWGAVF